LKLKNFYTKRTPTSSVELVGVPKLILRLSLKEWS
jgi:hypothetical protein